MANPERSNPEGLCRARSLWTNIGQDRPAFAVVPGDGQESVWDYPRPPAIVPDQREVAVSFGGVELARTSRAVRVCETASPPTFYVPEGDVFKQHLRRSDGQSFCEWKGRATYWSLVLPGQPPLSDIAWSYEDPSPEFVPIQGYYSFYPSRVVCSVEGEAVTPQPGGFYGGWITPEVVGPFKGDPGTLGW